MRTKQLICFINKKKTDTLLILAVRGNKGFTDGEHYWEIIFLEPPIGASVMIGIGTNKADLRSNLYQYKDLIGESQIVFGYKYIYIMYTVEHQLSKAN